MKIRESKFGKALVVETCKASGAYVLGFRIDPAERLQEVFQEISSLHQVFSENPVFGVKFHNEAVVSWARSGLALTSLLIDAGRDV